MFVGRELAGRPCCCKCGLGGGSLLTDIMAGSLNSCLEGTGALEFRFPEFIDCGGGIDDGNPGTFWPCRCGGGSD